jgi:hypothetical protein
MIMLDNPKKKKKNGEGKRPQHHESDKEQFYKHVEDMFDRTHRPWWEYVKTAL